MMKAQQFFRYAIAAGVLALVLSGCAASSLTWPGSSPAVVQTAGDKPVPKVQDCVVINTGTPSKYVCNGKTYTHHELRKLREESASSAMASQ
jgi:hypothetical protein